MKEKISIIIPTYLRQEIAIKTLKHLTFQSTDSFEVLVIDQTPSKLKNLENFKTKNFKYVYKNINQVGLPNARNVGAEIASGDFLIFLDDDCIPEKNLINNYIKIFNSNYDKCICVGGRVFEKNSVIFKNKKTLPGGWLSWYGKSKKNFDTDLSGRCKWAPGGNFAVRKNDYFKNNGFDDCFIGNAMFEDVDFGFRFLKFGDVIYSNLPKIEHLRIPTGGTRSDSMDKSMYYRSHNTVYFLRKHKKILNILPAFIYLNLVALNDLFHMKHSIFAVFWCWKGFFNGFRKKVTY